MASSTTNVKMGVCRIRYGGRDLGYTKGGVEFSVTTETHKVMIDQFGNSEVNEIIMGRSAKATIPLAETTLDNLVKVMPGASLYSDGAKAVGSITFTTNPANAATVTVGPVGSSVAFTFKTAPVAGNVRDVLIGASASASVANLLLALQSSSDTTVSACDYSATSPLVIGATYGARGIAGNSFVVATTVASATVITPIGGTASTKDVVSVTRAVGTSLLDIAKELVLHPISAADNDYSQDVVLPKTAAAGAISFAFKVDQERTYNIEFNAYPDTTNNNVLFQLGDKTATTTGTLQTN